MSDAVNPTTKILDWATLVKKADGKDRTKKEDAYVFSNGRRFKNTDDAPGGPYGDEAAAE